MVLGEQVTKYVATETLQIPLSEREVRRQPLRRAAHAVDALITYRLAFGHIPGGIAYGIIDQDGIVISKGLGFADHATECPMTEVTPQRINSITKFLFTATALMQLQEQGKINLDDQLANYLPEFQSTATIKQALSHTAGFRLDLAGNHWQDNDFSHTDQAMADSMYQDETVIFDPGSAYHYSNLGFGYLGKVIQKASGQLYETYIQKNIISPLGLQDTYAKITQTVSENLATGYGIYIPGRERATFSSDTDLEALAPAAGGVASVHDLCTLITTHFPGNETLLTDASKEALRTLVWSDENVQYGLGLHLYTDKTNNSKFFGHSGTSQGSSSQINFDPDHKMGTVVAMNCRDRVVLPVGVHDAIQQFTKFFQTHETDFMNGTKLPEANQYEGLFDIGPCHIQLLAIDDKLFGFVPTPNGNADDLFLLKQVNDDTFQANLDATSIFAGETLTFKRNDQGEIKGINFAQGYSKKVFIQDGKVIDA